MRAMVPHQRSEFDRIVALVPFESDSIEFRYRNGRLFSKNSLTTRL
jgi:hypothetical protein